MQVRKAWGKWCLFAVIKQPRVPAKLYSLRVPCRRQPGPGQLHLALYFFAFIVLGTLAPISVCTP